MISKNEKQRKFGEPKTDGECPKYKQRKWFEFDEGVLCQKCQYNINKRKHQKDKEKCFDKIRKFVKESFFQD